MQEEMNDALAKIQTKSTVHVPEETSTTPAPLNQYSQKIISLHASNHINNDIASNIRTKSVIHRSQTNQNNVLEYHIQSRSHQSITKNKKCGCKSKNKNK